MEIIRLQRKYANDSNIKFSLALNVLEKRIVLFKDQMASSMQSITGPDRS